MPRDPRQWDTQKGASRLNDQAEAVLEAFRGGEPLTVLAKRFGMSASGLQNWLKARGEYSKRLVCSLPECDVSYDYRSNKLYCTNLHARRANARDRNATGDEKAKNAARNKFKKKLYNGEIERPTQCERCGRTPKLGSDGRSLIQADHHHGYDEAHALDVWWLCKACDVLLSRLRRNGMVVNRKQPALNVKTDPTCTTQLLSIDGVTRSLSEWAADRDIAQDTLYRRLSYGWDPIRAVSTPVRKPRRKRS